MIKELSQTIAILQNGAVPSDEEKSLSSILQLEFITQEQLDSQSKRILPNNTSELGPQFVLNYGPDGLSLNGLQKENRGRLLIDFDSQQMRRRRSEPLRIHQFGKAVGLNKRSELRILDATAGFATDAVLLAAAGCQVTAYERSALVFCLLQDAINRMRNASGALPSFLERLEIQHLDFLEGDIEKDSYDVVYLDPMFPASNKGAKSKKGMQFLQQLLDQPDNELAMLQRALLIADERVVVKRGRLSPCLGESEPDLQFKGKSNRYDVYFAKQ